MIIYPHLFRTKIMILGIVFLVLIMITGSLFYWMLGRARYYSERSRQAHNVYQEYLVLSRQTYNLFKQLVDTLITEEATHQAEDPPMHQEGQTNQAEASEINEGINATLDRIRLMIASEVAYVEEHEENNEKEELLLLSKIENRMKQILTEFAEIRALTSIGRPQDANYKMIRTLENSIDQDFKRLIDSALEDEREEVVTANTQLDTLSSWLSYMVIAVVLVALVLGGGLLVLLICMLKGPLDNLLTGIQSLTTGNLAYRLPVDGHDEFARIATGFNDMAQELEQHQLLLEGARANLETRVNETSQELRLANESLVRADQTRRQFFADISHELRTPITVILGESQFTLRGADRSPAEYKDALQRVTTQAQQLSRLVDDLLFVARSEAGDAKLKYEPVVLDKLIGEVCTDAQVLADAKSIQITFHAMSNRSTVSGDPGRLRQLFLILLENAVHYSKRESQIGVVLSASSTGVVIKVTDSGVGIAPHELESVFERFYRGEQAASLNPHGSGLGLPVAKAIVEAHDGKITIDSQLDNGTTIGVTLPVAPKLHAAA